MIANVYLNSANGLPESELDIIFDIFLYHCIDLNLNVGGCMHGSVMHEGINNDLSYRDGFYVIDGDNSTIKTRSSGYAGAIFAHGILNNRGRCKHCIIDK